MADRYPDHALAPLALRWLLRYYASGEAAWRVQHDVAQQAKRLERAVAIGRQVERTRLDWFLEPEVRFPLAAAYRGLGDTRAAERLYQAQGQGSGRDGWWQCAQGELRLEGRGQSPRPRPASRAPCVRAGRGRISTAGSTMPFGARPSRPRSQAHSTTTAIGRRRSCWPTTTNIYTLRPSAASRRVPLAQPVPHPGFARQRRPGLSEDEGEKAPLRRPRDGDLSAHDRVEFLLDIDRDFATYYQLAVDRRGWTIDRCWEDRTWDPQWFVATRREQGRWTVEAAIPLKELTGKPPRPGDVWALGVQRVVPGVGFQSWTTPAAAATALPDGFGYLVFE